MKLDQLDESRVDATYQRMMQSPYLRERAQKRRLRPMAERVARLATQNLAFAALLLGSTEVRHVPQVGGALEVVAVVAAVYQIACFLLDSVVVYADVRALEAGKRDPSMGDAPQGEAATV